MRSDGMSGETCSIYMESTFGNFIKPPRDGHAEIFDCPAGLAEVLTGARKKQEKKTSSVLQYLLKARKRLSSIIIARFSDVVGRAKGKKIELK